MEQHLGNTSKQKRKLLRSDVWEGKTFDVMVKPNSNYVGFDRDYRLEGLCKEYDVCLQVVCVDGKWNNEKPCTIE